VKDPVELSAELGDRLCDILASEGELVTRWVAVAEVIETNGDRSLRTFIPNSATAWDNLGMLTAALENAKVDWHSYDS
jgi:hypothetical protein